LFVKSRVGPNCAGRHDRGQVVDPEILFDELPEDRPSLPRADDAQITIELHLRGQVAWVRRVRPGVGLDGRLGIERARGSRALFTIANDRRSA
jgi:hypothetical protein